MKKDIRLQDKIIGDEIARQRKLRELTQEDLAWAAGVSRSHISRLEHGMCTPTYRRLEKIEDAMDLPHGFFSKAKRKTEVQENIDRTVGDLKLDILHRGLSEQNVRLLVAATTALADTLEELEKEQQPKRR